MAPHGRQAQGVVLLRGLIWNLTHNMLRMTRASITWESARTVQKDIAQLLTTNEQYAVRAGSELQNSPAPLVEV